jgi:hypothetical protein
MVVNDPAALELGVQGAVACSLLAHLNNQDLATRRCVHKKIMLILNKCVQIYPTVVIIITL